jgi:DNA-binding Lrp family transcriptional regulator
MQQPTIKDRKIMASLRTDARQPLTIMSRKLGIPVSTIFDRMRALEGTSVMRTTALIDFSRLGYSTRVALLLKVPYPERQALQDYLLKSPSVNTAHIVANDYDFFVDAVFRDLGECTVFIHQIEQRFKVQESRPMFLGQELARERFFSDLDMVP